LIQLLKRKFCLNILKENAQNCESANGRFGRHLPKIPLSLTNRRGIKGK
jgi:hypothetical protein